MQYGYTKYNKLGIPLKRYFCPFLSLSVFVLYSLGCNTTQRTLKPRDLYVLCCGMVSLVGKYMWYAFAVMVECATDDQKRPLWLALA